MEGSFNFKNLKPTLSTPTKQGKTLDTNFKKQVRQAGMPIKEDEKENKGQDKEKSLKKRIFKLDKMETLVHTDELLSKKFDELKGTDPDLKWGYHWNEVILNLLFNDYILNSPKYLQKYKTTRAKEKTRRGEEGIAQLQNDINKEKEASSGAEERKNDLMAAADQEELNELFGFQSKQTTTPSAPRSQNDQYFIDGNNRIVAIAPYLDQNAYKQVIQQYAGKPNIKQVPWYAALHGSPMTNNQPVQGVPAQVSDQSSQDAQQAQQSQTQYGSVPAMVREENVVETTGSGSSGAFSMGLDAVNKEIADRTYQNETTTSASSGQYSGPGIWAKNPSNARFAHKPAWKGGKVLGESVVNGDENYLTDPTAFKKYISQSEIIGYLNEDFIPEANETPQQTAQRMLGKVHQWAAENPELKNDPHFQDVINKYEHEAKTGQAYIPAQQQQAQPQYPQYQQQPAPAAQPAAPQPEPTSQWKQPVPAMAESTDQDRYEDVIFLQGEEAEEPLTILHQQGKDAAIEFLKQWHQPGEHMGSSELGHGSSDNTYDKDGYHLAWNDALGYIGLSYEPNYGGGNDEPLAEHHLHSRQEKVDFIVQNTPDDGSGYTNDQLAGMSDEEIEKLYLGTEHKMGMNELFGFGKTASTPAPAAAPANPAALSGYKNQLINILRNVKFGSQIINALNTTYDQIIAKSLAAGLPAEELAQKIVSHYGGGSLAENQEDDKSEIYREIEARLSPNDHALPFDELQDIANQYGISFEDATNEMMKVISDRQNVNQNDVRTVVGDALKDLNHGAQNHITLDQLNDYLGQNYDMSSYDPDQVAIAYEKLTTDPMQMALYEASNFKQTMVKDLKYTGRQASDNESDDELESKDGLFKGKWNDNKDVSKEPVAEGFGGDPEVGEDQYGDQQSANEYITLEKQLQELTALKNSGNVEALKAKLESLPMIPMSSHGGNPDELGHRDLENLGYLRVGRDYSFNDDGELTIENISRKPIAQLMGRHLHRFNIIKPGEQLGESVKKSKVIAEKAESKSQQRFMGMVHAAQKGELKNPSPAVAKAAASMSDKDAEDFASTKHKGLPNHVKKDKKKVEEGIFGNDRPELNIDQIAHTLNNFKQAPDSPQLRDQFVKVKDYVKTKAGNIARMPQLKMWLDQNMPKLSNYVGLLWGNWDLMPTNQLSETESKMKINEKQYKELVKAKMKSTGKSLKNMGDDEKKQFFNEAYGEYNQIKESMVDDQPDSIINNQEDSMANSMDSDELNKDGAAPDMAASATGGAVEEADGEPQYYNQGGEDPQVAQDAAKFRAALKAKYGVDSISDLSNAERQEVMKNMNFGDKKNDMDMSQYVKTDADKINYAKQNDPTQVLNYLNKNLGSLESQNDYRTVASQYKAATGQQMPHPMAIYAALQRMSPEERGQYAGIENYFKTNMSEKMNEKLNEERKNPAILNVEKLGAENAKNFKADMPKEDALSQDKTYPHDDGLHKAPVFPDPSKFYIAQGKGTSQELAQEQTKDAKTMADIEREQLAKSKGALANIGNATADGKNIPKRNLTKEEKYELAMNRGDGMQDIVYDNKPSEKFEKRMEQDMGDNIYKIRQDKMDYKAKAPMYNKDTQPTEKGMEKEENNKFAMGYNNESVTGKFSDEYGKIKLVEFKMTDVQELTSIDENAFKLSVDGMGNKYSLVGKKINENEEFEKIAAKYDFYINESKVFAVEKKEVVPTETKKAMNESKFDKMKHLMNYKANNYVDPSKSVKF